MGKEVRAHADSELKRARSTPQPAERAGGGAGRAEPAGQHPAEAYAERMRARADELEAHAAERARKLTAEAARQVRGTPNCTATLQHCNTATLQHCNTAALQHRTGTHYPQRGRCITH
jgi:hypothetical protein